MRGKLDGRVLWRPHRGLKWEVTKYKPRGALVTNHPQPNRGSRDQVGEFPKNFAKWCTSHDMFGVRTIKRLLLRIGESWVPLSKGLLQQCVLSIEIGQCLTISISRDNKLCHFCSYNAIENEAHFMSECPLYNPAILDKFPSIFQNAILGSPKSFFQSDHEVGISLYLTEVTPLCHSKKLASLKPSLCIFNPISLLAFRSLKSTSLHWRL